jgi:hypothetical protein
MSNKFGDILQTLNNVIHRSAIQKMGAMLGLSNSTYVNDAGVTVNAGTNVLQPAEHGAGAIGTAFAPRTYRRHENGHIITEIHVDLTGLGVVGTAADDVIGLVAGGAAYIGRNVVATNGIIYKAEISTLELPAGSATITTDINITMNSSATLEYDGAASNSYLFNTGGLAAGQTVQNLVPSLTANDYIYITEGDTAATTGVYSAGQFIIRLYGHPVLS